MTAETSAVTLGAIEGIVGRENARDARPEDAIDGVQPRFVATPRSIEEAGALMALASRNGLAVTPRGSGSKMGWGNRPRRVDLVIETGGLNRVLEHAAGDLVVIAQAGTPLAALQEMVGRAGQMLAIDSFTPNATLGGIIAANAAGPRRVRYGTMKDLLIGITIVLPDGTVAKSGGKVVKNVAGYDLGKLFTGSLGTLGLIVETIFRLHALPRARGMVEIDFETPGALGDALQALLHSPLVPIVLDVRWESGRGRLIALFEGVPPGVDAQVQRAIALASPFGQARALPEEEVERAWSELVSPPWTAGETGLKISTILTEVPAVLAAVDRLAGQYGVGARVAGSAGAAVLLTALAGEDESVAAVIRDLRVVAGRGGNLVVLQAPRAVKDTIDIWGSPGDALPVARRVKEQFDPQGIMNPGRFIGGI